jgi:hypothetical protein
MRSDVVGSLVMGVRDLVEDGRVHAAFVLVHSLLLGRRLGLR